MSDGSLDASNWVKWLATLLTGLLLVLVMLIMAWFMRALPPMAPVLNIVTIEPNPGALEKLASYRADLGAALSAARADADRLSAQLLALRGDLAHQQEQCVQPDASVIAALPAERWLSKDLSVLQGCWLLGREAPTIRGDAGNPLREDCTSKAGRICFDDRGQGQREQTISCPHAGLIVCRAPIAALFGDDGSFSTTQPDTVCQSGAPTHWHRRSLNCRRVDDQTAACRDSGRPELGLPAQDQEFRRAP